MSDDYSRPSMRVHVLPPTPHLDLTTAAEWCAYTQKVLNLTRMLTREHHDVYYYGSQHSTPDGKLVPCWDSGDVRAWYPDRDLSEVFNDFDPDSRAWVDIQQRCIERIRHLALPGDMLAVTMGVCHQPIIDALPDLNLIAFESGIGYEGSWLPYRVFESVAWQHHTYGRQGINDGRFYDTVIPNAFDPDGFESGVDHGYLLFMARSTPRKGTEIVRELARSGHQIVQAGQGDPIPGCEHVGVVFSQVKRTLLANATALLSPTMYIEPFGGVAVEAQLSGTPVIATPWGAYPETVEHGRTGFLCRSLADFDNAVRLVPHVDRAYIAGRARRLYSLNAVAPQYSSYLTHLQTLTGKGWYAGCPDTPQRQLTSTN